MIHLIAQLNVLALTVLLVASAAATSVERKPGSGYCQSTENQVAFAATPEASPIGRHVLPSSDNERVI